MRHDNSHHLVAAAQRRRADTLERARRALHELGQTGQRHTITQIAAHAGISRSWLYAQPELRDQLRRLTTVPDTDRSTTHPTAARIRRLATTTTHPRPRTHPRTRQRKPSTPQSDRPPTRAAPRRPHRPPSRTPSTTQTPWSRCQTAHPARDNVGRLRARGLLRRSSRSSAASPRSTRPAPAPASISAWRTHLRSVSGFIPSRPETAFIAAHSDS